jgi:hypothetical protein
MRKSPVLLAALLVLAAACSDNGSTEPKVVPAPVLTSVTPNQILIGSGDTEMTFTGSGFQPESQARFRSTGLPTTFVSETEVRAVVPASLLDQPGIMTAGVFTLAAGKSSEPQNVTIFYAPPTISSLSYNTATVNMPTPPLVQVNGTGFFFGSKVLWNGQELTTLYQTPTRVMFTPVLTTAGTAQIAVRNPAPGGGTSATTTFTVTAPN